MDITSLRKEYDPDNGYLERGTHATRSEISAAAAELRAAGYKPFLTHDKELRGWPDSPAYLEEAEIYPTYNASGAPNLLKFVAWIKLEEDGKHYVVAFEYSE